LLIARYALAGVRRYGGWKAHLDISDSVLSARLATLTDAGVFVRARYSDAPERFEYHLTESGLALWPLLLSIWGWEREQAEGQADALPQMVHRSCGSTFVAVLRCAGCHQPATVADVDVERGPSGAFERSAPVGTNRRRTGGRGSTDADRPGLFPETMTLIGSRWSSAVLGAAFFGAHRFSEFERMIGAPPTVVAERLKGFVDLGVLEPADLDVDGDLNRRGKRPSYRLTAKGRSFFPVVATFLAWGERWRPAADGPAVVAHHLGCGRGFVPELACSVCSQTLTRASVAATGA